MAEKVETKCTFRFQEKTLKICLVVKMLFMLTGNKSVKIIFFILNKDEKNRWKQMEILNLKKT